MIGQTSLSIAYGIDVAPRDDPILARTGEAHEGVFLSQNKGFIFNLVPFCTPQLLEARVSWVTDIVLFGTDIHFPWWFPGASFKKDAATKKHRLNQSRDSLHEAVEKALVRTVLQLPPRIILTANQKENGAAPSIAASMISDLSAESTPEARFMARALPLNIYAGKIQCFPYVNFRC